MSEVKFWLHRDGKDIGPLAFEQLLALLREKKISPETLVRSTSRQEYIKLGALVRNIELNSFMASDDPLHGLKADARQANSQQQKSSPSYFRRTFNRLMGLILVAGCFIAYEYVQKNLSTKQLVGTSQEAATGGSDGKNDSEATVAPDLRSQGSKPVGAVVDLISFETEFKSLPSLQRRIVQSQLKDLGLYLGAVDGIWGGNTASSLESLLVKRADIEKIPDKVFEFLIDREKARPTLLPDAVPVTTKILWSRFSTPSVAPLTINVSPDRSYYFKLRPQGGKTDLVAGLVAPGQSLKTQIPLGTYELVYAAGDTWYGEEALFGHGTQFYKTDTSLVFSQSGNRVSGHTISLILRRNGNLRSLPMSAADF